jgi:hypothetical protein
MSCKLSVGFDKNKTKLMDNEIVLQFKKKMCYFYVTRAQN